MSRLQHDTQAIEQAARNLPQYKSERRTPPSGNRKRLREYWRGMVDEWQRSGLSAQKFADRHELSAETLRRWIRRFKKETSRPKPRAKTEHPQTRFDEISKILNTYPDLAAMSEPVFLDFLNKVYSEIQERSAQCSASLSGYNKSVVETIGLLAQAGRLAVQKREGFTKHETDEKQAG